MFHVQYTTQRKWSTDFHSIHFWRKKINITFKGRTGNCGVNVDEKDIKRHGKEAKKEEVAAAKVHTTIFNATTTRVNCSSSQRPHIAIVQTDWSLREEVEATIANPKLTREICRTRRLHINKLILIIKYKGSDYFYRVYCTQLITRV